MNKFFNIRAKLSQFGSNVSTLNDDDYSQYAPPAKEQPAQCLLKTQQQVQELQKSIDDYFASL